MAVSCNCVLESNNCCCLNSHRQALSEQDTWSHKCFSGAAVFVVKSSVRMCRKRMNVHQDVTSKQLDHSVNFARWQKDKHCNIHRCRSVLSQSQTHPRENMPTEWHHTITHTTEAETESPIYCGAMGPKSLMRAKLNEHPACYLYLDHAVSRFPSVLILHYNWAHSLNVYNNSNL